MNKKIILYIILLVCYSHIEKVWGQCTCLNMGPELVVNGDFSAGNSGFSTSYTYASTSWPGYYGITTDASLNGFSSWCSGGDHTTGTGNFMWVDASSTSALKLWSENISVTKCTNYAFSFWFCNVNQNSFDPPGTVQLQINGVLIGTPQTAPTYSASCQWVQYCATWNSGNSTSAQITISNQGGFFGGDDFGFDDVSFRSCSTSSSSISVTFSQTNVSCNGGTNGSANISASGGTAPYTYSWSPSGGSNASATGLSSGTYTVTVTDVSGCGSAQTQTILVTQPAAITSSASSTPTGCGINNGSATVTAGGGTSPFTYSWNPGGQTTSVVSGLSAGNYSVTITDAIGCTKTETVVVTQFPSLTVSVNSTPASCGGNSGTASVSVSSGNPPYTYSWSNGQSSQTATDLFAGNYSVTITDGNGCSSNDTVTVAATGSISATATNTVVCSGQSAVLSASGGTTYSWSDGSTTASISITPTVNATYTIIVSSGSCADTVTATVSVGASPTAAAWNDVTIPAGSNTTLAASGGGSYLWNNAETDSVITVSPLITTVYCVTVSNGNCTDTACVTVFVEPLDCGYADDQLFVPDVFSPNGDTKNDVLGIYYPNISCIKEFEFIIYDRWGEKVFEATSISATWDGAYKGKAMNTAVFVYYMKVVFINENEVERKGNVSLIR